MGDIDKWNRESPIRIRIFIVIVQMYNDIIVHMCIYIHTCIFSFLLQITTSWN